MNAVTTLVGELAYEFMPTTDQQLLQIDSWIDSAS